jgi:DNA-binding MarR family transcriptional regulator
MIEVKPKKVSPEDAKPEAMNLGNSAPRPKTIAAADRLHSIAIHLLRRVRQQDAATGEGPARLSALSVLVFAGPKVGSPKTLGELADAEQVKPPTMSRIVAGLQRSRLVRVTRDPQDARRMHIRATARGTRLLHQGRQRRIEYLAAHLDSLTSTEVDQLEAASGILERLLRNWR